MSRGLPLSSLVRHPVLLVAFSVVAFLALTPYGRSPVAAQGDQPAPQVFLFSTGEPDGRIGMASRPGTDAGTPVATQETKTGDDFILTTSTGITAATFTGLLPSGTPVSAIQQVRVEIYRVFPKDSNTARTPQVPTRTNSPSDVEFDDRDSANNTLAYTAAILTGSYTVANSVDTGIHPIPNQTTGGEGPRTGEEVRFSVTFKPEFVLPADHYFFVPQVLLSTGGHFLWLSAPGPAVFTGDLQAWIRNADLDPDWLRVGTDIVGGAARFNGSFTLFSNQTGTMTFFPYSGTHHVGEVFQTSLYLFGNGQSFTSASATVTLPNLNLQLLSILPGDCGVTPTTLSFDVTLPSPKMSCRLYTLVLLVAGGRFNLPGVVGITNAQLLASDGSNIVKAVNDAVFTLTP